jgi:hypothetical protein
MKNLAIALSALTLILSACNDDTTGPVSKSGLFKGAAKTIGHGTATPWVRLNDAGDPTSYGVTLSDGALEDLPTGDDNGEGHDHALSLTLPMPAQAAGTNIDHISLDWNPSGHEPAVLYGAPHFDVHFYMISEAQQAAIPGGVDMAPVDAKYIAPDYWSPDPTSVPMMGRHWVDSTSHEFRGEAFDRTFIYGTSAGKMVFLEPMITLAYLKSKPSNATQTVKMPTAYPVSGKFYPSKYTVNYDPSTKETVVMMESLVKK